MSNFKRGKPSRKGTKDSWNSEGLITKEKVLKEDSQIPRRAGKRQKAWECKPNKNGYHDFKLVTPNYGDGRTWEGTPEEYWNFKDIEYKKEKAKNSLTGWLWKPSRQYECARCKKFGWNKKRVEEAMNAH